MAEERPDALLKSALEKIVYFEARSEQLHRELQAARSEATRLKGELEAAGERELALRRELAGREAQLKRAQGEREELQRVHEAWRRERAALMAKLLEASQIHHADGEVDFDLASFISTLRGEVLALQSSPAHKPITQAGVTPRAVAAALAEPAPAAFAPAFSPAFAPAQVPAAPAVPPASAAPQGSSVTRHAERLRQQGRLGVSVEELRALSGEDPSAPRAEESLFEFSVRELQQGDVSARIRAAERLKTLGLPASAPALAAALNAEQEPGVQVALLTAFAAVANASGAPVVEPLLHARAAEVRIAALKTLLALDPGQAAPHLSAAVKDPDRSVRRRASLLALGLEEQAALTLGEEAVKDADPEVRGLAALALGASSGERARSLLLELLRDREPKVRLAAAQSLSRILGQDVSGMVHLDDARRRREIRRLAGLPVNPVRASARPPALEGALAEAHALRTGVLSQATPEPAPPPVPAPAPPAAPARAAAGQPAPGRTPAVVPLRPLAAPRPPHLAVRSTPAAPALVAAAGGGLAVAVSAAPAGEALSAPLIAELRAALRGRTPPELARALGVGLSAVEEAVDLLCARGHTVRRGPKVFLA